MEEESPETPPNSSNTFGFTAINEQQNFVTNSIPLPDECIQPPVNVEKQPPTKSKEVSKLARQMLKSFKLQTLGIKPADVKKESPYQDVPNTSPNKKKDDTKDGKEDDLERRARNQLLQEAGINKELATVRKSPRRASRIEKEKSKSPIVRKDRSSVRDERKSKSPNVARIRSPHLRERRKSNDDRKRRSGSQERPKDICKRRSSSGDQRNRHQSDDAKQLEETKRRSSREFDRPPTSYPGDRKKPSRTSQLPEKRDVTRNTHRDSDHSRRSPTRTRSRNHGTDGRKDRLRSPRYQGKHDRSARHHEKSHQNPIREERHHRSRSRSHDKKHRSRSPRHSRKFSKDHGYSTRSERGKDGEPTKRPKSTHKDERRRDDTGRKDDNHSKNSLSHSSNLKSPTSQDAGRSRRSKLDRTDSQESTNNQGREMEDFEGFETRSEVSQSSQSSRSAVNDEDKHLLSATSTKPTRQEEVMAESRMESSSETTADVHEKEESQHIPENVFPYSNEAKYESEAKPLMKLVDSAEEMYRLANKTSFHDPNPARFDESIVSLSKKLHSPHESTTNEPIVSRETPTAIEQRRRSDEIPVSRSWLDIAVKDALQLAWQGNSSQACEVPRRMSNPDYSNREEHVGSFKNMEFETERAVVQKETRRKSSGDYQRSHNRQNKNFVQENNSIYGTIRKPFADKHRPILQLSTTTLPIKRDVGNEISPPSRSKPPEIEKATVFKEGRAKNPNMAPHGMIPDAHRPLMNNPINHIPITSRFPTSNPGGSMPVSHRPSMTMAHQSTWSHQPTQFNRPLGFPVQPAAIDLPSLPWIDTSHPPPPVEIYHKTMNETMQTYQSERRIPQMPPFNLASSSGPVIESWQNEAIQNPSSEEPEKPQFDLDTIPMPEPCDQPQKNMVKKDTASGEIITSQFNFDTCPAPDPYAKKSVMTTDTSAAPDSSRQLLSQVGTVNLSEIANIVEKVEDKKSEEQAVDEKGNPNSGLTSSPEEGSPTLASPNFEEFEEMPYETEKETGESPTKESESTNKSYAETQEHDSIEVVGEQDHDVESKQQNMMGDSHILMRITPNRELLPIIPNDSTPATKETASKKVSDEPMRLKHQNPSTEPEANISIEVPTNQNTIEQMSENKQFVAERDEISQEFMSPTKTDDTIPKDREAIGALLRQQGIPFELEQIENMTKEEYSKFREPMNERARAILKTIRKRFYDRQRKRSQHEKEKNAKQVDQINEDNASSFKPSYENELSASKRVYRRLKTPPPEPQSMVIEAMEHEESQVEKNQNEAVQETSAETIAKVQQDLDDFDPVQMEQQYLGVLENTAQKSPNKPNKPVEQQDAREKVIMISSSINNVEEKSIKESTSTETSQPTVQASEQEKQLLQALKMRSQLNEETDRNRAYQESHRPIARSESTSSKNSKDGEFEKFGLYEDMNDEEIIVRLIRVGVPITLDEIRQLDSKKYIEFLKREDIDVHQKGLVKAIAKLVRAKEPTSQESTGSEVGVKIEPSSEQKKSTSSKKAGVLQLMPVYSQQRAKKEKRLNEIFRTKEMMNDPRLKFTRQTPLEEIEVRLRQAAIPFCANEVEKMTKEELLAFYQLDEHTEFQKRMLQAVYREIKARLRSSKNPEDTEHDSSFLVQSQDSLHDVYEEDDTMSAASNSDNLLKFDRKITDDELRIRISVLQIPFSLEELSIYRNPVVIDFMTKTDVNPDQKKFIKKIWKRVYDRNRADGGRGRSSITSQATQKDSDATDRVEDIFAAPSTSQQRQETPIGSEPNKDFLKGFEEEDDADSQSANKDVSMTSQKAAKRPKTDYRSPAQITCVKCRKQRPDTYMPTMPTDIERRVKWIEHLCLSVDILNKQTRYPVCMTHFNVDKDFKKLPDGSIRPNNKNILPKDYRGMENDPDETNDDADYFIPQKKYNKRVSAPDETEGDEPPKMKKIKKEQVVEEKKIEEPKTKKQTLKEKTIPDRRYINGKWISHDKKRQMVYWVDNEWKHVPEDILLNYKRKWNMAPAAKLLPSGNFGIAGEIFNGVRKVFNEYLYEWVPIDEQAN